MPLGLTRGMRFLPPALLLALASFASSAPFPGLKLTAGFRAEVFADTNHVGNAVAICFDRAGALYAVEANRRLSGTWGVTMSRWWSMEDYSHTSLEDRTAMYARWAHIVPPAKLTHNADVLRRILDPDHNGRADDSEILDHFNAPLEGNAAGVLAWADELFIANAPTLWRAPLNRPSRREPLHSGLGVRVGVYGHDLHGLVPGPDGRLYFSLGDRGFHLRTKEGTELSAPRRGAVFRCFPDGSGLELFHIGLRNPQDLAFNELGDLFTVDNDMGGVDRSRVVHVIEGGDSGWDATFQLTRNFREETKRADHPEPPWFTENLWETRHDGQPAWLHPPVAHLTAGPSGMEFDPGWGLPPGLRGAFFVCDFKGSSPRSGIHSFHLEPDGAGWRMTRTNQFAWGILPADIEFGYDGCLYVADWIGGWGGDGERRIVRLQHDDTARSREAAEVRSLMSGDWRDHPNGKLAVLLAHFDRRVRLSAQYELARRREHEVFLTTAADQSAPLVKRLHGVHGLWQIGLGHALPSESWPALRRLLSDPATEVRAQVAKVIGEVGSLREAPELAPLLHDTNARVRCFAAVSLGKIGNADLAQPLLGLLRRETDPLIRQATARALSQLLSPAELVNLGTGDSAPNVRLATVLALRHAGSPLVARFLDDAVSAICFAAIRAAHDEEIRNTIGTLADFATKEQVAAGELPFPIRHRLMNARFRRGTIADAAFLAELAADAEIEEAVRREALSMLEHWTEPSPFDRVTWHHRPGSEQREQHIAEVIDRPIVRLVVSGDTADLVRIAARLVNRFDLGNAEELRAMVITKALGTEARASIFHNLAARGPTQFDQLCRRLLLDEDARIRVLAAERLLPDPESRQALDDSWRRGSLEAKQFLLSRTNLLRHRWGRDLLTTSVAQETRRDVGPLSADVWQAANRTPEPPRNALSGWNAKLDGHPLGRYSLALAGGNARKGGRLFATHAVQCVRCHKIKGFGGDAGPDLSRVGRELKRMDLVTALIDPSARIAPGFATIEFELRDGEEIAGFVEREDAHAITLLLMDGRRRELPVGEIRTRSRPASAMPTMRDVLTLMEIRDLVAYLASLK